MPEIQRAITGATGAVAGAALAIAKTSEEKESEKVAEALAEKREKQKDLEHAKKIEILDAKKEEISLDSARKDAALAAKLEKSQIEKEGLKSAQSLNKKIGEAKLQEGRARALTAEEKLKLIKQKAADSLAASRTSKREAQEKKAHYKERLAAIAKKRR